MSTTPSFLPVAPGASVLQPLGIDRVRLDGGFWGDRQRLNHSTTIGHCLAWEARAGWIDNFRHTLDGTVAEHRRGREFSDSDVYKLIEAMAWEVGRTGDEELEAEIERLGALAESIQCADGYVSTRFGNAGQEPRYSDFAWGHELYCFGHLIQAAVARLRTGRDGAIVRVALRAADHVCREFGADGRQDVCGHPEIEVALAELARVTGEDRYLEQARLFVERRGHHVLPDIEFGRSYYQDDVPFRDAEVLRGHAVRALYLCAAAVDIAVERGDEELLDAARRQYDRTLARRTYITGGMGSHHQDEAFGEDFELPPDRAYCETCAGIGSVMVAWRLLLATGDMSYGDVIERTLHNILAVGLGADGESFFYANTLHRRTPSVPASTEEAVPRAESSLRAPWFAVSCCPTNISRTLATLGGLVATTGGGAVQVHQYVPGTLTVPVTGGQAVLRIVTHYPDDGAVRVEVVEAPGPVDLDLRIPGWAEGATVDGVPVAPGVHRVEGVAPGGAARLLLPMTPRLVHPDPRIDAVRGCVAVEQGPLVMCAESIDLPDGLGVDAIEIAAGASPRSEGADTLISGRLVRHTDSTWPYDPDSVFAPGEVTDIRLVPYHSWANRGPASMRIWLPIGT